MPKITDNAAIAARRNGSKPVLRAYKDLRSMTGDFSRSQTLHAILGSLGRFPKGRIEVQKEPLYIPQPESETTCVPFQLGSEGKKFFREIFDMKHPSAQAHLLMLAGQRTGGLSYLTGAKILPLGIIVNSREGDATCFFDLSYVLTEGKWKFPIVTEFANNACILDFPGKPKVSTSVSLQTSTTVKAVDLAQELQRNYGNDGLMQLMNMEWRGPNMSMQGCFISHTHKQSEDFQELLLRRAQILLKGRKVSEIGTGNGIVPIYALKFGAKSVRATDISLASVMLARWNLVFAQETGQIPPVPEGQVEISHKSGFAPGEADTYLFNTPSIRNKKEILDIDKKSKTYAMPEEEFMPLFEELKTRLEIPGTRALWRMLPVFPDGVESKFFPFPSYETLDTYDYFIAADRRWVIAYSRAIEFLKRNGIVGIPNYWHADIFMMMKDNYGRKDNS